MSLRSLSLQTGSSSDASAPGGETGELLASLRVESGAFSGLEASLTSLHLGHNGLRQLPGGEICRLSQLTALNLTHNRFGAAADIFGAVTRRGCLPQLAHLDLSHNELTSLNEEEEEAGNSLLRGWPNSLLSLSLNSNFVRFVGRPTNNSSRSTAASQLRQLDLANNQISQLPADLLSAHAPQLHELSLANNSLSALPAALLVGQLELEQLDLSGNILGDLPANFTADLFNLLQLDLSHNQLTAVGPALTAPLVNLQVLRLAANRLSAVKLTTPTTNSSSSAPSGGLVNLASLDLSANQLTELTADALAGLPALTQLSLSQNRLTAVHPAAFANASASVLILDLSHNRLSSLPTTLRHLTRLQTLDLSHNLVSNLSNSPLSGMAALWRLQMAGNQISRVPPDFFASLTALQVLDLSANRLAGRLEAGVLDRNVALRAVRLDGNQLRQIDGVFGRLPALIWLNVSDNVLAEFDYAHVPPSLHWLDLSHNQIPELGNYFRIVDGLAISYLDASFNLLRQVTGDSLPHSLEILLLNDNTIIDIAPYTFFEKANLTKVDLSVNEISSFGRNSILLPLANSRETLFYLGGNPIVCDCDMTWFKSVNVGDSVQNFPIIADLESIYCPLVEARSDQFLCSYQTHCFSLCQCCQFDSCDCEMTCPAGCTCYHDNSWTKNIIQCSSSQLSVIPDSIPMDATEVFLDGNRLDILRSHTFIGRKNLRSIHLNSSNIEKIENQTFNGLKALTALHLENNSLKALHGFEFSGLSHLRELYLQGNQITSIHNTTFRALNSLEVLFLQGNLIIDFPAWQLAANPYLVTIRLAENLWSCDCDFLPQFSAWLQTASSRLFDADQVRCVANEAAGGHDLSLLVSSSDPHVPCAGNSGAVAKSQIKVQDNEEPGNYLPLMIAMLASFAAVCLLGLVTFLFRHSIRVWIHARTGVRVFESLEANNPHNQQQQVEADGRLFDAYLSYSIGDEAFVRQVMAHEMEIASQYRVCLHHRDFPSSPPGGGGSNAGEIVMRAAEAAHRTIIVLSANFLATEWSRYDYKSGLLQAVNNRGHGRKVVFVVIGGVEASLLDPSLRLLLKNNITLHWGEQLFWEKLRYSLPDPERRRKVAEPQAAYSTHRRRESSPISPPVSIVAYRNEALHM